MTAAENSSRDARRTPDSSTSAGASAESSARENLGRARRLSPASSKRYASDDEILGIESAAPRGDVADLQPNGSGREVSGLVGVDSPSVANGADDSSGDAAAPEQPSREAQIDPRTQAALDANPALRRAWDDARSYREAFATPEEARAATALLSDLDRMDALFFSRRPEDHAELARAVASLDPAAFASLATAMGTLAANGASAGNARMSDNSAGQQQIPRTASRGSENQSNTETARDSAPNDNAIAGPSPAQIEFLHAANAAAVQGVLDAIETQVDRLLPEGVSKSARNRVVGEIYRELDGSLGANRQLGQQMRDAFRSGTLDAAHQRAVVALVTGRARQALPGIAKRVLNEWTSTVVAANQDRLARQRAAAHRVDIAGSGRGADGGRRSLGPRDIDYTRMSDSDILNL